MNRFSHAARFLAIAGSLVLAVSAVAQEAPRPVRTVTTAAPVAPPAAQPSAREDAARTMPTYDAFGASSTASTTESLDRLSRDFAGMAEVGTRRLGAVPIWPRGDMNLAGIRIRPYVREGFEWESNFYRVDRAGVRGSQHANDDTWTHTNTIGALADTALAGGRLRLFASAEAEWDLRYDNGGSRRGNYPGTSVAIDPKKEDTFEFDGMAGASYRWPAGLWVRGGLGYERRADPIDAELTHEFQRTNRRTFLSWGLDRDVIFGSKFRYEMGVSVRDVIGRERGLEDMDRTETTWYAKASYPFLRDTTRIFGRVDMRQDERESKRINDGDVFGFDAGIEGSIPISEGEARGLRGQIYVGFDHALYEDEVYTEGSSVVIRDENDRNTSLSYGANLQYMMSRKSTIELRMLRGNYFSFHGNFQVTDRADLTFTHKLTERLTGRVATFFEHSDPSGRLAQEVFTPRTARTNDYPSTTRFGAGIGARYMLNDWLDADMSYDWERRNNRLTGFVNHRVSAGLTFNLNGLKARPRTDPDVGTLAPASYAGPAPTGTRPAAPKVTTPRPATPVVAPTAPAPPVPTVRAPAVPPKAVPPVATAMGGADIRTSGSVRVEGGAASGAGKVIRISDASGRATIDLPGGTAVEVTGPAVVRIVEVSAAGSRIQLVLGTARARVGASALEIQTGTGPSLVLQNAAATVRTGAAEGVSFQKTAGDFARVHDGSSTTDLGASPWTKR